MNRDDLHDLMTRATDAIEAPGLYRDAVPIAARRRNRRRRVLAVAGATAAVAIGWVAVTVAGDGGPAPAPPVTSPTSDSTPTPAPDPAPGAVKPRWDPFTIKDVPLRESVLPELLDPPATAPSVADLPMDAAVVAWPEEGYDLRLLGTDGTWRSVPGTLAARDSFASPALSNDGRQVALSTSTGILVVDVTRGRQETIPWPDPISVPWDSPPQLSWLPDGRGWIVQHWPGTWLVGPDGRSSKAPFGGAYEDMTGLAVDADGTVVERRWVEHADERELRLWRDGRVESRAQFPYWGDNDFALRDGVLAMVGGEDQLPGDGGPMVFDVATGQLLAYLPITDPNALYTDNGYFDTLGFLDSGTLLVQVTPVDQDSRDNSGATSYLATWSLDSNEFERLTTGDIRMRSIVVAPDVLAGTN